MNGRNDEREIEDDGFYTVEFNQEPQECETCTGSGYKRGYIFGDCPTCAGEGYVPNDVKIEYVAKP